MLLEILLLVTLCVGVPILVGHAINYGDDDDR